jgi:hypothetical protein
MAGNVLNIPASPPIDLRTGNWQPEWRIWIQSPSFLQIETGIALGVTSGGTGLTVAPSNGQLLIGNVSGGYSLSSTIPAAALPAFTGDVTKAAGGTTLTLATLGGLVGGVYGNSTTVSQITVNTKGQITSAAQVNIDGTIGSFTVATSFGCNGKTAQTSAAVNAAIAGSAGAAYTATEQGLINSLLALVNQLRVALVANGITV